MLFIGQSGLESVALMDKIIVPFQCIAISYNDQNLHVSFVVDGISVRLLISKTGVEFTLNK